MKIHVTQKHINDAIEASKRLTFRICEECIVSQALREVLQRDDIHCSGNNVYTPDFVTIARLDKVAEDVVRASYRDWIFIKPFTFEYTPVEVSQDV